jgi:transposase-like protein
MESEDRKRGRRYSAELKAQGMAQCEASGASVPRVAVARGSTANLVHRWRQRARRRQAVPLTTTAAHASSRS